MAFSITYKPLFNVNILHRYFLNKGLSEYISMTETEKAKQLDSYDLNSFLNIVPTQETQQKLNGYNLVFRKLNSGFAIWAKVTGNNNDTPFIPLEDDLSLTFLIQLKNSAFYNYTNLKLENAGKLYLFSNRRLGSEPVTFPLINKMGDNISLSETFVLSNESGSNQRTELYTTEKNNLFGMVRIFMKADESSLHVTDSQGKIIVPPKIFELVFANRKTVWRYIFRQDQKVKNKDDVKKEVVTNPRILITKTEQPLTEKGFIPIELDGDELPNPSAGLIKLNTLNSQYYSEIYM